MFSATSIVEDGRAVVHLAGELDLATVPVLVSTVSEALAAGPSAIVLDLVELSFVDSTGLAAVARLSRRAGAQGASLTVAHPSERARSILAITGLDAEVSVDDGAACAVGEDESVDSR